MVTCTLCTGQTWVTLQRGRGSHAAMLGDFPGKTVAALKFKRESEVKKTAFFKGGVCLFNSTLPLY